MATTVESIQQLYIAYFNRPADAGGLAFWVDSVNKGVSLSTIAANFAAQNEYKVVFANMSEDQIVARVYQNLFNRLPEQGGLDYWANLLRSKTITVDKIVQEVAASAQQDPAKGPDTISIQSKVAAAVAFTDYLNTDVAARVAYSSGAVNTVGINYLAGVSDVASLTTAKAGLPTTTASAIINGNVAGGTVYTLTVTPDTVVGTSGNDTFVANTNATKDQTLTTLDSIDGGTGTDILSVVSADTALDLSLATGATVKNVETVNLTSAGTINGDISTWAGVTQLNAVAIGAATLTAAATTNASVTIANAAALASTFEGGKDVTVTANGVTGAASIKVGDVTAAKGVVTVVTNEAAAATTSTAAGIEVTGGTTVNVTANLKGAVNNTITGGAIKVTGTADTTTVSVTQTAAATAGATKSGIVDGGVTIADLNAGSATKAATISTVSLANYGNSTISSNALTNLTLAGKSGTLGITSGLTKETVTTLNLTVNGLDAGAITDASNHFKTIAITATGADSTIANIADTAATALTIAGDKAVTFTSAAGLTTLKTVTVTGAAGVGIDVSGITSVTGIDASASTGANTVTVLADQTTFTGGAGVDTVTITKDATKAIDGGAGTADELVLNDAAASFTNGAADTDITGFEVLGLGAAADGTYDASGFAALHIAGAVAAAVEFGNVSAGASLTIDADPTKAVTYSLKTNTSADAVALTISNADTDGVDFSANAITLTSVESVTLNSLGSNKLGTEVNKVDIVDATATSLTVTGTQGATITGFGGSTLKTIDATAIGADLTLDLTGVTLASAGVTFKGGDGNYVFTDTNLAAGKILSYTAGNGDNTIVDSSATTGVANITLGNGENSIDLGATKGVNTVAVGTGINSIVLGTGASIVTIAADTNAAADIDTVTVGAPATANNYATIIGLGKGDVLSFADKGTEVWAGVGATGATAKVTLDPSTALFADYVAAASAADGSTNGTFSWFQFGGNTYVVEDKSAGAGFVAGTDIIVKLTGTVDLTKAVVGDHIITLA